MYWFSLTEALPLVSRRTEREEIQTLKTSPKKAAEIIDSFFELMARPCQKLCSRWSPFNYAGPAVKEVSYILFPHRYASCINLDREPVLWQFTPEEKKPRGRKVLS